MTVIYTAISSDIRRNLITGDSLKTIMISCDLYKAARMPLLTEDTSD